MRVTGDVNKKRSIERNAMGKHQDNAATWFTMCCYSIESIDRFEQLI